MQRRIKLLIILLIPVWLSGCQAAVSEPTATPTLTSLPTSTVTVTETQVPTLTPSDTPLPSTTPTRTARPPTRTPVPATSTPLQARLPQPGGTPAAEWNGLPVMPGALAGEASAGSYAFTIAAAPTEIQAYYERELVLLGWSLFAVGSGENGSLLLIFMQGMSTANISVIVQPDGTSYVLLVR